MWEVIHLLVTQKDLFNFLEIMNNDTFLCLIIIHGAQNLLSSTLHDWYHFVIKEYLSKIAENKTTTPGQPERILVTRITDSHTQP